MNEQQADSCALCGAGKLTPVYRAASTKRNLTVMLCPCCGLVQSLPRIDRVAVRTVAVSGGADWGNLRYGKGFRVKPALARIGQTIDLAKLSDCLDVGANRGQFIEALLPLAPRVRVTAIEPDRKLDTSWGVHPQVEWLAQRVEEVSFAKKKFDLIYCSHTLEHLATPKEMLVRFRQHLNPNGILFVEVPDIEMIGRDDVIEEWFIDKHLFHFSAETLAELVCCAGFVVEDGAVRKQAGNLMLIGRPDNRVTAVSIPTVEYRVTQVAALLETYQNTKKNNLDRWRKAVERLHALSSDTRIAVWGAGRIFDTLVTHGGLTPQRLVGLVDRHLARLLDRVHGCVVLDPKELPQTKPDLVLIASRQFEAEIRQEIASLLPPEVRTFSISDLLQSGLTAEE